MQKTVYQMYVREPVLVLAGDLEAKFGEPRVDDTGLCTPDDPPAGNVTARRGVGARVKNQTTWPRDQRWCLLDATVFPMRRQLARVRTSVMSGVS
jgi:hypothetical protein